MRRLTLKQMEAALACVDEAWARATRLFGAGAYPLTLEKSMACSCLGKINWDSVPALRAWLDVGYSLALPKLHVEPNLSAFSDRVREKYHALRAVIGDDEQYVEYLHRELMQEMIDERLGVPSLAAPTQTADIDLELEGPAC